MLCDLMFLSIGGWPFHYCFGMIMGAKIIVYYGPERGYLGTMCYYGSVEAYEARENVNNATVMQIDPIMTDDTILRQNKPLGLSLICFMDLFFVCAP